MLDSFGCIAVLASLMLASIGLSDYLEDMLNKINRRGSRPLAIFLTYFPAALACICPARIFVCPGLRRHLAGAVEYIIAALFTH